MLRFTLKNFQKNLTLTMNLFQIQTPLQLNKWMIMKCNISWSSSTGSRMIIFWMLNFICSRLYCWFTLLQNFKQSLLCCFITMEELMLQSQITCHTFLCLFQPRPLWNWLTETRDMSKELGLFYVIFLTVTLYIKWDQFIIVQVTLPTSSHQVPSNFMLVKKRLHLKPLSIVTLLTLKVVLGDHPNRLKQI